MNQNSNQDRKDFKLKGRTGSIGISNDSMDMSKSKSQPACINPLAKAMEKRPNFKKADKAVKSSSETWYEEKIESQSQIRFEETQTEHDKRKKELLKQLKEAEAEVKVMKDLLEQRDKLLKDSQEEAENPMTSSVEKMDETSGIDPETGQKTESSQEEKTQKQKSEKFSKKKIQDMKEKLLKMNKETESYLSDIENTMQYLESLETASDRMGPVSEETRRYFGDVDNEEDFIAKVYEENTAPNKDNVSKPQEDADDSDNQTPREDDEFQNENVKHPEKSQFFITHQDMRNKLQSPDE